MKDFKSNFVEEKNSFLSSIEFKEDPDKKMLLKIQDAIEKKGIKKEVIYELTKNLTKEQKQKLLNLYEEQIKKYELSIENHRKNILKIRNQYI